MQSVPIRVEYYIFFHFQYYQTYNSQYKDVFIKDNMISLTFTFTYCKVLFTSHYQNSIHKKCENFKERSRFINGLISPIMFHEFI